VLRSILSVALLALAGATAAARPAALPPATVLFPRAQLARFATRVARRDGLSRRTVLGVLSQARAQPRIIEAISRPPEQVLAWWQYRRIFLTPGRIAAGVAFWQEHREALAQVSAQDGVAPQYIVAILGAETDYGRITGSYRVLDALATLAFDYPPRGHFFRYELEQFLVLAQREKLDPLAVTGSYAGAMGPLQFMPSAYLRYAVDEDGRGRSNLFSDWDDIFASVGRYLQACGWRRGAPVLADVTLDPGADFHIDPRNLALDETIGELNAHGVQVNGDAPSDTRVVLLLAQQQDGPTYRVGFDNFQALTRYNHSALYAMAVTDLARAIARGFDETAQ
jgi:membrane-bound lytic murein transglycosylase B